MDAQCPPLESSHIEAAKKLIRSNSTAKLVGLIVHLTYWSVFGHINPLPLDKYHMKQLFISISKILGQYEKEYISG